MDRLLVRIGLVGQVERALHRVDLNDGARLRQLLDCDASDALRLTNRGPGTPWRCRAMSNEKVSDR
jgi:hypothetical protein